MNNDLISRSELIKALEPYKFSICGFEGVLALIDNAPTIHHPNCDTCEGLAKQYSMGFQDGFLTGKERPQDEYVPISKLRLMTVEECAGHTIDYAMGWKACVEWIKKGGAKND